MVAKVNRIELIVGRLFIFLGMILMLGIVDQLEKLGLPQWKAVLTTAAIAAIFGLMGHFLIREIERKRGGD